jgi:hypothetical protein
LRVGDGDSNSANVSRDQERDRCCPRKLAAVGLVGTETDEEAAGEHNGIVIIRREFGQRLRAGRGFQKVVAFRNVEQGELPVLCHDSQFDGGAAVISVKQPGYLDPIGNLKGVKLDSLTAPTPTGRPATSPKRSLDEAPGFERS